MSSTPPSLPWPPVAGCAPDPNNAKHPKGRRKRTATKDKAILEEAYKNDPKPDKEARSAIVERVTLNEKEVQIWFQNRRQNDRRKSQPLSVEEITALRFKTLASPFADFTSPPDDASRFPAQSSPSCNSRFESWIPHRPADDTPGSSFPAPVGYVANRRNLTASSHSAFHHDSSMLQSISDLLSKPIGSPSGIRISLSLGGKAELEWSPARVAPARPSSALPEPSQPHRASLQRSHSAIPLVTLPSINSLDVFRPAPMARGRSRDVQAWESCADSEKRDQLTTQAEHESRGSAIADISLLKSSGAVLQAGSVKRNASVTRPRELKRHKLSRSSSQVEPESSKMKVAMLLSPNDSDKENWSPVQGDQVPRPQAGRRPLPCNAPSKAHNSRRTGGVLEEQKRPRLFHNRANTAPSDFTSTTSKTSCDIYEDPSSDDDDDDDAMKRFLSANVSPSKKGDMDCIAGLLSLSKGNWR
ncbi:hypothetical protein L249_3393 [Ophiocordyceps polyrhachis-furcata BCC 54312]|uniref:Homeobox domain-containing protein n=1 Tax=Ophiocordyceps polyrhachis-furcata BCC 54312 TaxID=1330021 RepID=A0A367LM30_9HYPO|nr:hypothetical protein L249_3393 [Ophiocordyceps polyrhachis-furcata BCC 54312]